MNIRFQQSCDTVGFMGLNESLVSLQSSFLNTDPDYAQLNG